MTCSQPGGASEFDSYAEGYDQALAEGISLSGEDKNYFARGRVQWLDGRLEKLGARVESVLDFGCGTGSSVPFLLELAGVRSLVGVDVSDKSLEVARKQYESARVRFSTPEALDPRQGFDLAFCNGVFHHILLNRRAAAARFVSRCLRPGGYFAFWENNPWNPGTRLVMSRIPFDRDAQPLTAPQAGRLLHTSGFQVVRFDFLFIFPRALRWFRFLEPWLARFPLGAQYLALARKPLLESGQGDR